MLILWIKKSKNADAADTSLTEPEAVSRHNEAMKQFRTAHPDLNIIDAKDIITADGNLLAMASGVKLAANTNN